MCRFEPKFVPVWPFSSQSFHHEREVPSWRTGWLRYNFGQRVAKFAIMKAFLGKTNLYSSNLHILYSRRRDINIYLINYNKYLPDIRCSISRRINQFLSQTFVSVITLIYCLLSLIQFNNIVHFTQNHFILDIFYDCVIFKQN